MRENLVFPEGRVINDPIERKELALEIVKGLMNSRRYKGTIKSIHGWMNSGLDFSSNFAEDLQHRYLKPIAYHMELERVSVLRVLHLLHDGGESYNRTGEQFPAHVYYTAEEMREIISERIIRDELMQDDNGEAEM